jgi:hypothetical protein
MAKLVEWNGCSSRVSGVAHRRRMGQQWKPLSGITVYNPCETRRQQISSS